MWVLTIFEVFFASAGEMSALVGGSSGAARFFHLLLVDVHVEASLLSARYMKSNVAVVFVALNACTRVLLATYVAHELPSGSVDVLDTDYGL